MEQRYKEVLSGDKLRVSVVQVACQRGQKLLQLNRGAGGGQNSKCCDKKGFTYVFTIKEIDDHYNFPHDNSVVSKVTDEILKPCS